MAEHLVIAVDAYRPQPAEIHARELTLRARNAGFFTASSADVMASERHVGEFIDRMVLNTRTGIPSFITRFRWDGNYPWLGMAQPTPVDYVQGTAAEVLKAAEEWARP